jgi:multimeric flavodoxin WrbA
MHVVAFNGSPRTDGNTALLLRTVLTELEHAGIRTELVSLSGSRLRGCTACRACFKNQNQRCIFDDDLLNDCVAKMATADGMLLGSPTYFADITPEMKALMDRAGYVVRANGGMLRRKVGAAVVAARRAGAIHAFDSLNHFFTIAEMFIVGSSYWNIGIGREIGEVGNDDEGIGTMRTLGSNMAWLLARLQPCVRGSGRPAANARRHIR